MVTITVSNVIRISTYPLPPKVWELVMQDLTFDNPELVKRRRLGKWVGNLPRKLVYYSYEANGMVALPRGYLRQLTQRLDEAQVGWVILDQTVSHTWIKYGSTMKPWPHQKQPIQAALNGGVIVSPAGSGKTNMGLDIISRIGQPTLWITHTEDLVDQTRKRALSILKDVGTIGIIGDGKWQLGDKLTIATVQTLIRNDLTKLKPYFGCLVLDECHHLPATTFSDVVVQFPAKYVLGLTATPTREDGLEHVMYLYLGPEVARVTHEQLRDSGVLIFPDVKVLHTRFREKSTGAVGVDEDFDYAKMITQLMNDAERNRLIADTVLDFTPGHYTLILSERIEHLEILKNTIQEQVPEHGIPTPRIAILHGNIPKRERKKILEDCGNKEIDILLATQIAREGLDITHLDRLHWALPKRAQGAIEQEVGRIMRSSPGKLDAIVFDYVDYEIGPLRSQHQKRMKVLKAIGCKVPRRQRSKALVADELVELLNTIQF